LEAVTVSSGEHSLSRVQQRISRTSSLYKTGCVPVFREKEENDNGASRREASSQGAVSRQAK
jgi:hypothetical protein